MKAAFRRGVALLLCAVWIGGLASCNREDKITRYSIAVPQRSSDVQLAVAAPVGNAVGATQPRRMLAAIVPQGKQTWFFKLVGPDEPVRKQQEHFTALVKSVRFAGATSLPTWNLPDGWRQRGASGMRLASIEIEEGERTLELTVIPLDTRGNRQDYVLANVNRWREQLGLAPVAVIHFDDDRHESSDIRQFELSDSTLVTLVNLVGREVGSHTTAAEFDMANHPHIGNVQHGTRGAPADDAVTLTYETPAGWSAGDAAGMRRASFEVADGGRKVEITVISLPRAGGDRLANVNRWRKQIKLREIAAAELAEDLQNVPLADTIGDYVELIGPAETEPREAILAVMADIVGTTWFFKLKGDAELAARERERFHAFIRSVKFLSKKKAGHE